MRTTCLAIVALSLALVSTAPLASAQPAGTVHHVGVLGDREGAGTAAFRQELQDRGYSEGRNIRITYRWSEGNNDRYPALAADLVRLKVNVIVAVSELGILAAKAATATIPIVFITGDPVLVGLAPSLALPGGNLTGFAAVAEGITAKQLELLKEMVPGATRVAILAEPYPLLDYYLRETVAAADRLSLRLQILKASTAQEIDRAFEAAGNARVDAIHVYAQPLMSRHRKRIVALAKSRRLPAMYLSEGFVIEGGLMSFGPNVLDIYRRMAGHVDKILKGARPADLPVEQPTKYNLVINVRTARELGLTVPPLLLLRADRIVE